VALPIGWKFTQVDRRSDILVFSNKRKQAAVASAYSENIIVFNLLSRDVPILPPDQSTLTMKFD
jgi:hypothetical protein